MPPPLYGPECCYPAHLSLSPLPFRATPPPPRWCLSRLWLSGLGLYLSLVLPPPLASLALGVVSPRSSSASKNISSVSSLHPPPQCQILPLPIPRYRLKFQINLVWDLIKPISNFAFNLAKQNKLKIHNKGTVDLYPNPTAPCILTRR
jgi:hypothetical protein